MACHCERSEAIPERSNPEVKQSQDEVTPYIANKETASFLAVTKRIMSLVASAFLAWQSRFAFSIIYEIDHLV